MSTALQKQLPSDDVIGRVLALVGNDMESVNQEIRERLHSDVVLIDQISHHIINSGGKRLRPLLLLLSAATFGYRGDKHITLAAIIEFIHTATLLHDDVVDASALRRGQATANDLFGNEASVLVGDFLYSRSFQMMVEVGSMQVMDILASTTNTISEGEVMQLMNCNSTAVTERQYMETINCKTAKLFAAATLLGALISGQDEATQRAMEEYGKRLGMAFQIIDDVLDYTADADDLGKNIGDDLAEGKSTLPLIIALQRGNPQQSALLTDAIVNGGLENIREIVSVVESTGALAYTSARAEEQVELAKRALDSLPDSAHRKALADLADFSIHRTY